MAHKKAGGSTRNGRDSESKRLGVKVYGGQTINSGELLLDRGVQSFMLAIMLVWGKIILFLPRPMVPLTLCKRAQKIGNLRRLFLCSCENKSIESPTRGFFFI